MKKKAYIRPEAETIRLRISDPVMVIGGEIDSRAKAWGDLWDWD